MRPKYIPTQENKKSRARRFIDDHPVLFYPVVFIVLWIFLVFPILTRIAVSVFDTHSCHAFTWGRRHNTAYSCFWGTNPVFEFYLNMFFGSGPIMGPFMIGLLLILPVWFCVISIGHKRRGDNSTNAKEATPYGTLEKHREILLASGAKPGDVEQTLKRFKDG